MIDHPQTTPPPYCAASGRCWSRDNGYTPRACGECQWNAGETGDYRAAVDIIAGVSGNG